MAYTYDAYDRRIAKVIDPDGAGPATATTERMVYDGDNIALTFDGTGIQTHRYLYGSGVDQVLADETATSVNWALVDYQGTVRDVIDNNGQVLNHIVYDSYGQVTSETNPSLDFRFGYTGRERDKETGLQYNRARYYDSRTGAFIGQDPIGFAAGDANLYRYVGNSPTNFSDPSGLLTLYKGNLLGDFLRAGALSPFAGAVEQIPGVSAFDVDIKVNAGEKFAEDAQRYYANRYIDESKPWYDRAGSFAGGLLASLWTCENSDKTATVLKSALEADQALKAIRTIGPTCFVEGTLVLTNSGKKPIETLRPGDWIVSWDEETGQVVEGSVTEWYEREAAAIIDIFIGVEKISCTTDHPFWVENRGWVLAFQLKEGMALQNREGEPLVIDAVRRRDEVTQVFNVEIDGLHTYFVSEFEILSHNMCGETGNGVNNRTPAPALENDPYHPSSVDARRAAAQEYYGSLFDPKAEARVLGYDRRISPDKSPFDSHGQSIRAVAL